MSQFLAYRPFLDPLDLHQVWFLLLIPLSLGVSVTYKAVRLPTLDRYWRQVALMTTQIVVAIIAIGAASFLLVQYVLPLIAPMPR